jgi:hypothetical protein
MNHVRIPPQVSVPLDGKEILHPRDWKKAMEQIEWDEEDWRIFCEAVGYGLHRIAHRKRTPPVVDFQI